MARLRFVHAADLHLDSPFRGIRSEAPEGIAATLLNATFNAYDNIIELCLEERVDALLVAGDVYDGADRSLRAQLRFGEGLARLDKAGIRSFICHGNHDPLDGWEARLDFPPGCVRFGPEVTGEPVFPDEPKRAAVFGMSYPRREMRENLSPFFHGAEKFSTFNVGLLHANVGGNTDHDSYAPCTIGDLADTSMDYWALGHVHTRSVLREQSPTIVYPGNPQGRHINETGPRGVYIVEVDDSGTVKLDFRPVDVVRWQALGVDIAGMETEQALVDAINDLADSTLEAADGIPIVVRLSLIGRGPLHRSLHRDDTANDLREQLNDRYAHVRPWLWCEGVRVATGLSLDREAALNREDFVGDLARLGQELRRTPEALAALQDSLRELYETGRARRHLRDRLPGGAQLLELLAAAEEECLSELAEDEVQA